MKQFNHCLKVIIAHKITTISNTLNILIDVEIDDVVPLPALVSGLDMGYANQVFYVVLGMG